MREKIFRSKFQAAARTNMCVGEPLSGKGTLRNPTLAVNATSQDMRHPIIVQEMMAEHQCWEYDPRRVVSELKIPQECRGKNVSL